MEGEEREEERESRDRGRRTRKQTKLISSYYLDIWDVQFVCLFVCGSSYDVVRKGKKVKLSLCLSN
jgi:hypothetical protein